MKNIKARFDLLNALIETNRYKSYLEVGVQHGNNIKHISCERIVGVDPDPEANATFCLTSDNYFATQKECFDLIFIDGLHHQDQVEKDIINSLCVINEGGTIVVHDCNPINEAMQMVPRTQEAWTGDVWKSFAKFRYEWNYHAYVVDIDFGCGVIDCSRKGEKIECLSRPFTWSDLMSNRNDLLGLISVENWIKGFHV